jgi:hypothetical protein
MNMKTSPNDVSNQEILAELKKVSVRTSSLEATTHDILEVLHGFAGSVDERFNAVDRRLTRVEALMVTKDYLDVKLANQYSDIMQHTKREITKAVG